jgi:putative protease
MHIGTSINKPRLLSPVNSFKGAVKVIKAGADEIYCGVSLAGNLSKFKLYRGPGKTIAQLPDYTELEKIINFAHNRNVGVVTVVNEPFMSHYLEKAFEKHVKRLDQIGVDAIIIGDLGVLFNIKKSGVNTPLYASTYFMSLNREAVGFLKKIGFKRVILERHLRIDEISGIVQNSDIDVEVFCHSGGCSNINGNCYFYHHAIPPRLAIETSLLSKKSINAPCTFDYNLFDVKNNNKIGYLPIMDAATYCSLCYLPELIKTGVTGLKIVGRFEDPELQEAYTRAYRNMIDLTIKYNGNPPKQFIDEKISKIRRDIIKIQRRIENKIGETDDEKINEELYKQIYCHPKRCYYSELYNAPYKSLYRS